MTIILCLFIAFFVGVPICFALGIVSIGSLIASGMPLIVTVQRMFTGGDSIALIAIPLFMLSGELMFRGGMSKRLVDFCGHPAWPFPERPRDGQYPRMYVLRCHHGFGDRGHRGHRRHHDPADEGARL